MRSRSRARWIGVLALALLAVAQQADARPSGLTRRLLDAEQLPSVSGSWKASEVVEAEAGQLAGSCHKVSLSAIGATRVVQRTYLSREASEASQVVATFPDVKTAKRSYTVLESWRNACPQAGPLSSVDVGSSTASSYVLAVGDSLEAQGFVRRGRLISVIRIRSSATDEIPIEKALTRAAGLL